MLRICDVFLKCYVSKITQSEFNMAVSKRQLYQFFDDYTAKVARDWQIWRLIGRIKSVLKEPMDEIKEIKLKEMRSLMLINWEHEM